MCGQNWKVSVEIYRSFIYLPLSQNCPRLALVVSIKRISTQRCQLMSIMIDTGRNLSFEPSNKDSFKIWGQQQKLSCQLHLSKVVAFQLEILENVMILDCPSHNEGSFDQNIVAPALSALILSDEGIQLVPFQNNYIQQWFNIISVSCGDLDQNFA